MINDLNYTIRTMTEADIAAVVDFYNALEAAEPTDGTMSIAEYTQSYNEPSSRLCYTRYMVHLVGAGGAEGKLVGFGLVYNVANDYAAWSRIHVLPEYRRRGIGTALYQQLRQTVREKGASEWRASPHRSLQLAIDFWQRRGFAIDRYSWDMRLAAEIAVPAAKLADGFSLRRFVPGQDEEALWRVSNESFAAHYWFTPSTLEQRVYWTQQPGFQPSDIFFACNRDGAVVGYCWTRMNAAEMQRRGMAVGWIEDLGVIPAYQGRGLGRALLVSGVHYLRQQVEVVELSVEGENAKALPLYESVGFRICNGQVNMKRKLDWSKDER